MDTLKQESKPIHILFADDDIDDRFFFDAVISALPIPTTLKIFEDGEQLMKNLAKNSDNLPDVLFLDLNMPKINGIKCLVEIKKNKKLKQLPVIIYSTSVPDNIADLLYNTGAHYFVLKTGIIELQNVLHFVLNRLLEKSFVKPAREHFILIPASDT